MTGQEMCEYIVKVFPGLNLTAEEVWDASPSGELFPVYELYWAAIAKDTGKQMSVDKEGWITWV